MQIIPSQYVIGVIPEDTRAENLGTQSPQVHGRESARRAESFLKKHKTITRNEKLHRRRKSGSPLRMNKSHKLLSHCQQSGDLDGSIKAMLDDTPFEIANPLRRSIEH